MGQIGGTHGEHMGIISQKKILLKITSESRPHRLSLAD